jgi:nucleoid-associated protein YgaU
MAGGCASTRKVTKEEEPQAAAKTTAEVATPVPTPVAAPKKALDESSLYSVKHRDTLWDISESKTGFSDPYYWPALFRANRDVIEDPDLIYVDEQLKLPKGMSQAELDDARRRARLTPPYEPHTAPRPREQLEYLLD